MNPFDPMKALLKAKDKLEAKLAERKQLAADLEAGLDDMRRSLGEAADRALDKGDVAAYDNLAKNIATQTQKIEVAQASIGHAEKLVFEAQQAIFNHQKQELGRHLNRILKQYDKAGRALQANGDAYAAAVVQFRIVSRRLRTLLVNAGIRVPSGAMLTAGEINAAIGRLLLKAAPFNGIGPVEENVVPGAQFHSYRGDPTKWPSFIEEVQQRAAYLTRLVEHGPEVQAPVPAGAQEPSGSAAAVLNDVVPAHEGRTYNLAEATAHMQRPRVDLSQL
jgi:hypothetical protein